MEELILDIKPKFYWLQRAVANLRKEIIITFGLEFVALSLIIGALIATNNPIVANLVENDQETLFIYVYILFMGLIVFIFPMAMLLLGFLDKKNFEVTSYKVYNDRINFDEGFINHKYRSILFKDIKEIHLDQNFIQKKYKIATLRFITAASNQVYEESIKFQDIENPQFVYTKVKELRERN